MTERSIVLAAPGPLDARTGGYIYNQRIAGGLRDLGWQVEMLELDASFPHPTRAALEHASRVLAALPDGMVAVVDSLALGAMPDIVERNAPRLRIVALVHQPLAAATGLDRDTAARFAAGERRALHAAALIVVTGRAALPFLLDRYGVAIDRVLVVEPGTDRPVSSMQRRPAPDRPTELLTVATVNAGKGHETLLRALATLREVRWRLTCAGSLVRDPATADRVRATATALGLEDRVSFVGELDERALAACYAAADVFVLATRQETYGMAVAEALAHGLPVVATTTGAIPALVGDDAGLLVPVDDAGALASALARIVSDAPLRERLAEGARRRREELPTWRDASRRLADAIEALGAVDARG